MEKLSILAIETSGQVCSVCLQTAEASAEFIARGKNLHDELLAEYSRRIMHDMDCDFDKLDAVAVSAGPGSFTGLRIGAAFAKGLCFGNLPRLVAVPTLEAIASSGTKYLKISNKKKICSLIPSHKDLLYAQIFDENGIEQTEILHKKSEEIRELLNENVLAIGPGASKLNIENNLINDVIASMLILPAENRIINEDFVDADEFVPLYAQDFRPNNSKKKLSL